LSTTIASTATDAPTQSVSANPDTRLIHLQILRALAATLVVVDHTFTSLADRKLPYGPSLHANFLTGITGVSTFFIISGLIMFRLSSDKFGSTANAIYFAYRRIDRIVPMYWLATIAWFASLIHWGVTTSHAKLNLLLSLTFIPDYLSRENHLSPILAQGWTLNYEMSFYLFFAVAILFPRRAGIWLLVSVPVLLTLLGIAHKFPVDGTALAIVHFYTNPIIFLFAVGVLLGVLRTALPRLPKYNSPISPAFLILIPVIAIQAITFSKITLSLWLGTLFYCACVVALCSLDTRQRPGPVNRFLVLIGEMSEVRGCTKVVLLCAQNLLGGDAEDVRLAGFKRVDFFLIDVESCYFEAGLGK